MGMRDIPSEVTHGATAAAVGQLHRSARARETLQRAALGAKRADDVWDWVGTQPNLLLDGEPCPDAVTGALWARDRFPNVGAEELLARIQGYRRDRLAKDVAHGLLTNDEAEARLAGHRLASEDT